MTKRASKGGTLTVQDIVKMRRANDRQRAKEAGLLGAPVNRAWRQKNARAVASKRACRDFRGE